MVEGDELFTAGLGKDEIAGAMEVAAQMGIELVPTTTADGGCGPTVSDVAYAFLKERFVTGLAKVINEVDGVYLLLRRRWRLVYRLWTSILDHELDWILMLPR